MWPHGMNIPSVFILMCSTQMVQVGGSKCTFLLFPFARFVAPFFSSCFLFRNTLLMFPAATVVLLQCFCSILMTVNSSIAFWEVLNFLALASASRSEIRRTISRSCSSGLNCYSKFETKLLEETPSKALCILRNWWPLKMSWNLFIILLIVSVILSTC